MVGVERLGHGEGCIADPHGVHPEMGVEGTAITKFDWFHQGSQLHHLDPVVRHGLENVLQPGFEAQPVGEHQVGGRQQARLLGGGGEVVRVDADRDQYLHFSFVTNHSGCDVTHDRRGGHDDQTLLSLLWPTGAGRESQGQKHEPVPAFLISASIMRIIINNRRIG